MDDTLCNRLVQIGTVTSVEPESHRARVKFPGTGMTSGWLYVLQHPGADVRITPAGHTGTLGVWMPSIGATVAVLYLPIENGDGLVLGVV